MAFSLKNIALQVRLKLDKQAAAQMVGESQAAIAEATSPRVVEENTKKMSVMFASLDGYLKRTAARMLVVFSVKIIADFVSSCVEQFAKFDKALQEGVAIMGDVDAAMRNKLSGAAREIAKELNLAADDVAHGYYELASSGLNAEQSMRALPIIATFAKAGLMDVAEASKLLTTATNSMGYKSQDVEENAAGLIRTADTLTKVSTLAAGHISDFTEAINNKAGPALRAMHKDIEEGAAALAVLHAQGVIGQTAGERLAMFLRTITMAATKHKEVWHEYGMEIFDSSGKMKDLADVTEILTKGLGRLSPEQQAVAMQQLGIQLRTMDTVKAFLGQADAQRKYEDALRSSTGYTQNVADGQMKTFSERWGLIKKRIDDAKMSIGEGLIPALEKAGITIGDDSNGGVVGQLKNFAGWVQENNDKIGDFISGSLTVLIATIRTLSFVFNEAADAIVIFIAGPLTLLTVGFELLLIPLDVAAKLLWGIAKIFTPDKWGISKFFDDISNGLTKAHVSIGNFREQMREAAMQAYDDMTTFDGSSHSRPGRPGTLARDGMKAGKASKQNSADSPDGQANPDDKKGKNGAHSADHLSSALNELNAMLAKTTSTVEDDLNVQIARLEKKFHDIFGDKIPASVKAGLDKLKTYAKDEGTFKGLSDQIDALSKKDPSVENISALMVVRDKMQDVQATLEKGSRAWQQYAELIRRASDEIVTLHNRNTARHEAEIREQEKEQRAVKAYWDHIRTAYVNPVVNSAIAGFKRMFDMVRQGTFTMGKAFEMLGKTIMGALANSLVEYYKKKAQENGMYAAEEFMKGLATSMTNPAESSTHFAAAGEAAAVSAGWAALAGAASSASAAIGGGGGGSSGLGASNTGGRNAVDSTMNGHTINIYVDGVDPNNPRHQQLIGDTAREYSERVGGDVFVKPGRKP